MDDMPVSMITGGRGPLEQVLRARRLYPVFQPIVNLADGSIYAHEALIRGPASDSLHTPDKLLRAAELEDLSDAFEYVCVEIAVQHWGQLNAPGKLFINLSARALVDLLVQRGPDALAKMLRAWAVQPRQLVIEITEHDRVQDMDALADAVARVRDHGVVLALDDFGDGHSSLRRWSQLKPEIVKIDKYFTRSIAEHADKLKTLQALQQIATIFDSQLVAEGIEDAQDLRVLRDLGVEYGQGYFLGHPERRPLRHVGAAVRRVLTERQIAVFPEASRNSSPAGSLRMRATVRAPIVTEETSNDEVARIFAADPQLHAVALVEGERPIGIINRVQFMNEYSKLYYREVWGRRPCGMHANRQPRVIEREHDVNELLGILTSQDQRYLLDGFIVTENGHYVGLGTGDQLVRSVTETRIEAARHANPLTFLPGNIPISLHIERLLRKQVPFTACYADLNQFKPFNDYYGYWRGDEMICLLARVAREQCDPQRDFLGHVGGDDFVLLLQSPDWSQRCERVVRDFNRLALGLFDEAARERGGVEAEDRQGVLRFFAFTTVSIGAVSVEPGQFDRVEAVANAAAAAKREAKHSGLGVWHAGLTV